mgnify:CR=1 FL=1
MAEQQVAIVDLSTGMPTPGRHTDTCAPMYPRASAWLSAASRCLRWRRRSLVSAPSLPARPRRSGYARRMTQATMLIAPDSSTCLELKPTAQSTQRRCCFCQQHDIGLPNSQSHQNHTAMRHRAQPIALTLGASRLHMQQNFARYRLQGHPHLSSKSKP